MILNRDKSVRCADPAEQDQELAVHIGVHRDNLDRMVEAVIGGGEVTDDRDSWYEWGEPALDPDTPLLLSARARDEAHARSIVAAWMLACEDWKPGVPGLHAVPGGPPDLPAVFVALSEADDFSAALSATWLMQDATGPTPALAMADDWGALLLVDPEGDRPVLHHHFDPNGVLAP